MKTRGMGTALITGASSFINHLLYVRLRKLTTSLAQEIFRRK